MDSDQIKCEAQKILSKCRKATLKDAHHQMATRYAGDAKMFASKNPGYAERKLMDARYHVQYVI